MKNETLKKLVPFLIIGGCALILNLFFFSLYIKFFSPPVSSFLAFSSAITFNFFSHDRFLWKEDSLGIKKENFIIFYLGYSISMIINVLVVYLFQNMHLNIILVQLMGIFIGSLLNFFISKWTFTRKIL